MRHLRDPVLRREALQRAAMAGLALALQLAGQAVGASLSDGASLPTEVVQGLPQARLQGGARFRYFGLHVYDVQLWVPPAFDAAKLYSQPFALSLTYARRLKARDIAERSVDEMRRQSDIGDAEAQRWLQAMTGAFGDVRSGDRLTGLYQVGSGVRFFLNGQPTRLIDDHRFATLFFGIWLSAATSAPAIRRDLLGV